MKTETEIEKINARNKRVEADKAWETSLFRKALITIFTYIITAIVFYLLGAKNFYLNAFIPTIGYFLSTLSLPFIKDWWVENYHRS